MLQLGDRAYKTHKALTDSHILEGEVKSHTDGFLFVHTIFSDFFDLSYNPSLPSTSLGPLSGAGESLAKMELLLFFMSLLQKFTFQPPLGSPIWTGPTPGILVSSSNQCLRRYVLCPEPSWSHASYHSSSLCYFRIFLHWLHCSASWIAMYRCQVLQHCFSRQSHHPRGL